MKNNEMARLHTGPTQTKNQVEPQHNTGVQKWQTKTTQNKKPKPSRTF